MKRIDIKSDVLIIGGGAAGAFAALKLSEDENLNIVLVDKSHIKRSGCLAAGVNALNAYLTKGETPESYLAYIKDEFKDIVREDLVVTIAERLNSVTEKIEEFGLPILKDENGEYISRGKRSIKINGENIKPLIYDAVRTKKNIKILNHVNISDYIVEDNEILGAVGFGVKEEAFYTIEAKAVICATGGAAGIYSPNNGGGARHKMWYSPFNTGAGYAMGIRSGAEMTTFEMRFIALRCKDTIAPTGTIAQGVKAPMINRSGEAYVKKYGKGTTDIRLFATIEENRKGNGPCYLKTSGISEEVSDDLVKAYLNMAPAQVIRWADNNSKPYDSDVEVDGTEPYIVGGHTASGYWVDRKRRTTIKGLFAAGDVCGGSPKKYVTGAFAEGEIAAETIKDYLVNKTSKEIKPNVIESYLNYLNGFISETGNFETIEALESKLQEIMDTYAGGKSQYYRYSTESLNKCEELLEGILEEANGLKASDNHQLLLITEIIDRIYVAKVLVNHLRARKESRWRCYTENTDYPDINNNDEMHYVNSVYKDSRVEIIYKPLVGKDDNNEHWN
ncbi:MAG: adenylyl-sulfate reductase subunit alpha [Clostridiaceae bacterium]